MKIPNAFPIFDHTAGNIEDGALIGVSKFCSDRVAGGDEKCLAHYERLKGKIGGFYQCPYGFTSLPFGFMSENYVMTGVVATPRFQTANETQRAKHHPAVRVSREAILKNVSFLEEVESSVSSLEDDARTRLPQALHELRKLNAIVKQNAEIMSEVDAESGEVKNISSASELMTNIFEVIEALANLDGLREIALDQHIAIYDLAFKAKKIYQIRAKEKPIHIHVGGNRSIGVLGSRKTFPIVLTVLLENAIRYGLVNSMIEIDISRDGGNCVLEVRNKTKSSIDPERCFNRGVRFNPTSDDGSGLGLYLAKQVVLAHGGAINCLVDQESVTMRVCLPAFKE